MSNNVFLNFVGKHFNELKGKFTTQIRKIGFDFNHDVFYDTMLKCNDKITDTNTLDEEMENYFWIAFKNNTMREFNYSRNKLTEGEEAITDEVLGTTEDDVYTDFSYSDYENVSKMIIKEFGVDLYKLFALHANGTEYKDLVKESEVNDLKYKFRKIRDYVRKNYQKEE